MKRGRGKCALVVLALALGACQSPLLRLPPAPQTVVLQIHSTETTTPLLHELIRGYRASRPSLRLGFRLAGVGDVEILTGNLSSDDSVLLTDYLPPDSRLWAAPIGQDILAIITHPTNTIETLTLEQVRAIYEGRLTNWHDLGGEEETIVVASREGNSTARAIFEALVMAGRPLTSNARIAPGSQAMLETIARTPGAIGYAPLRSLPADVRPLAINGIIPALTAADAYPLRTMLFLVAGVEPHGPLRDFIAWVQSADGQRLVARHAVPLD